MAIVDKVVDKRGTRKVAQAYLEYLYAPEGQEIAARNYYRPTLESIAKKYDKQFPKVTLFRLQRRYFGGWHKAHEDALRRRRHVRPDLRAAASDAAMSDALPCTRGSGCRLRRRASSPALSR